MPASVSLSALSWSTPDGTPLFTDIDLNFGPERTGLVGRNGTGKSTLLRLIAGQLVPGSGQIKTSGTLALMRQDLAGQPDETVADLLGQRPALDVLERAEQGIASATELAEADWSLPARIEAALARCHLPVDPHVPLTTLSGGQRTRAALAALVLAEPEILLMDEPTNNLDRAGRDLVIDLLRELPGTAIIVSHDRELLEEMDAIVEITSLGAPRYGGGYSAFREMKAAEVAAAEQALAHAGKTRNDIAERARQAAERKARKDSAGRRGRATGGQPKVFLDYEKGRAEASGGAGTRLREARQADAEARLTAALERVEVLTPIQMELAPTELPAGRTVLTLEEMSGGYHPDAPVITTLSLTITGPERVVITGANGSGKSTLLKLVTGQLQPTGGTARLHVGWGLLDQHVGLLPGGHSLHEAFRALHPDASPQAAHAALARFGFRAGDALRRIEELSGGERLRAGLACVLGGTPPPQLLILDEPTNHLDLAGQEALEAALDQYDGAILAVSHDRAFLSALGPDRVVSLPT